MISLGLLFGCGEELSWGQRLFSIESNDYFNNNNLQRETNIHNLKIKGFELNTIVFTYGLGIIFSIYFLLFRPLYTHNTRFKTIIDLFLIPIPSIRHILFFLCGTILIMFIQHNKKWELWECLFALTIFIILVNPSNNIYYNKRVIMK